MANLSCSKACDIRGRLGDEPNEDIAYCDSAMIPWLVSAWGFRGYGRSSVHKHQASATERSDL